MSNPSPYVLIVAGGTGGHLYPGIATARAVVQPDADERWKAAFAVRRGDIGKELLNREGFDVIELTGQGWPRRLSIKTLTFPFRLSAGFVEAWRVLKRLKPRVVVGMGGYLSYPVLWAAKLQSIPTLIHEQNVLPGLSNRWLSRWVSSVAVSFPESVKVFPKDKVWVSGLPVRGEIGAISGDEGRTRFGLSDDKLTFLVFGGSLGAQRINEAAVGAWKILEGYAKQFQVLHITGEKNFSSIKARYDPLPVQSHVISYCHDMAAALAAADVVICRAGASTVAELLTVQKAALLIPYPFASENHQFYNAEVLVKRGVAEMLPDAQIDAERLSKYAQLYFKYPERLAQIRDRYRPEDKALGQTAARRLAEWIKKTP